MTPWLTWFTMTLLATAALSGCRNVAIKDHEYCGDKGSLGATCVHTLSSKKRKLTKPEWDKARVGMICETAAVFADVKTATQQLCQVCNCCTYEIQEQINTYFRNIEAANGKPLPAVEGPVTSLMTPIRKKLSKPAQ